MLIDGIPSPGGSVVSQLNSINPQPTEFIVLTGSPGKEINAVRDAAFMDNRSTIYWNPETLTDSQGKAKLSFYSADMPSIYSLRIVGVTSKGDLIDQNIKLNRN